ITIGILPDKYAKNSMLVIVPIISLPILIPDCFNRFIDIVGCCAFISYNELVSVMATSITAPKEPIKMEAKNICVGWIVKKLIVSYLMPFLLVKVIIS